MNADPSDAPAVASLNYYSRPAQRPVLCIHWHASMGSSNDEAMRLAREDAPAGTVVWAEVQTAARGRAGRAWSTGAGNASFTLIARPKVSLALAGRLGVAAGQVTALALRTLTGLDVRTKWPNDLYLDGRKLGGILVETRAAPGGFLDWAVIGIGINVAWAPEVEPPGYPAVCLAEMGRTPNVADVVEAVSESVLQACRCAESEAGWQTIAASWSAADVALGPLRVHDGDIEYDARGIALEPDGGLLVESANGRTKVSAGEVSIRLVP